MDSFLFKKKFELDSHNLVIKSNRFKFQFIQSKLLYLLSTWNNLKSFKMNKKISFNKELLNEFLNFLYENNKIYYALNNYQFFYNKFKSFNLFLKNDFHLYYSNSFFLQKFYLNLLTNKRFINYKKLITNNSYNSSVYFDFKKTIIKPFAYLTHNIFYYSHIKNLKIHSIILY